MSLALAIIMVLTAIVGSVSVFAQEAGTVEGSFTKGKKSIKGTVYLNSVVNHGYDATKNEGFVGGEVSAKELFKDAYAKYLADFKGQLDPIKKKPYENLVMYDKNKKFPSITYKIKFPATVSVDANNIKVEETTNTISKIETTFDERTNTVTFKMYLGNWNDYKGFFELYEREKDEPGHNIKINIPFTVKEAVSGNIGDITADGYCKLYKYGGIFGYGLNIVDVTAEKLSFNITK